MLSEPVAYPTPDFTALYPPMIAGELYESFQPLVDAYGDPNDHLWIYINGLGCMLQPIDDIARDMDGHPGWGQLLDMSRAKTGWLPWLGQWVGYFVPKQPDNMTLTQWDTLQRKKLVCMAAHRRGSIAAFQEALEDHLVTNASILIHERLPDDNHIQIYIYQDQIITTQALVTEAAFRAKAAGLLLDFNVITVHKSYLDMSAHNTIYSVLPPKYLDYSDLAFFPDR